MDGSRDGWLELEKTGVYDFVDRKAIKLILRFSACYTEASLGWPAATAHTCNPSTSKAKAGKP